MFELLPVRPEAREDRDSRCHTDQRREGETPSALGPKDSPGKRRQSEECDVVGEKARCQKNDPDCEQLARDTVYYVRALEAPKPGINAQNIRCERDSAGNCLRATLCDDTSGSDNCLADHEPRAWSSPIFVDWQPQAM